MREQAKKMRTSWETSKASTTPGDRARKQQRDEKTLQAYVHSLVDSALKKTRRKSTEQHVHYADDDSKQESKKRRDESSDDDDEDDYSQTFAALSLDSKISESSSFA